MIESTITNEIDIETAIVGFIDILGYSSLVERHQDNDRIINWLKNLIEDIALNFPKELRDDLKLNNPSLDEYNSKISGIIHTKVISDTILFTLYLDRIDFTAPEDTNFDPLTDSIWRYFQMIEMFCLYFIAKTGHIFRGGVSKGKHYESNLGHQGNLFIFSSAYLKAFEAEKRANKARIIIDADLFSYLRSLSRYNYIKEHLYEDFDGIHCIDIYSFLNDAEPTPKKIIQDIKDAVTANRSFNKDDSRALEKLNYFANYHNNYVTQQPWQIADLCFK